MLDSSVIVGEEVGEFWGGVRVRLKLKYKLRSLTKLCAIEKRLA